MRRNYVVSPELPELIALDFPEWELKMDQVLCFDEIFIPALKTRRKTTTVRYSRNKIRIPARNRIAVYESRKEDRNYRQRIGNARIVMMSVLPVRELDDEDGWSDGFSGRDELIGVLRDIYGNLSADDLVSIYLFRLF